MVTFFCKGFTRILEIGNIPVWVLPMIWRLGEFRDTKFVMKSLVKCYWMLLNVTECQGYNFYRFWVFKGKPIWTQITFYYILTFCYNKTSHSFLKTHLYTKNVKMTFCIAMWLWMSPLSQVILISAVDQISQQVFHTSVKKQ